MENGNKVIIKIKVAAFYGSWYISDDNFAKKVQPT